MFRVSPPSSLLATVSRAALYSGFALTMAVGIQDQAQAQEPPATTLPPVMVEGRGTDYKTDEISSPKSTAPLVDTPQTITVVPQEVIKEQGARTLTEILRNTPGISFNGGENGFGTSSNNFSMRGFDTSGNIFIDGSRDSGSYTRDAFNTEQVEIFKGPAADNGRGGAGGYINMVTKTPKAEDFATGSVSYGFDEHDSEARKRTTFDVNRALSDSSALRLNLMLEDSGVAGREEAEKNAWGVAPSLALGLGTNLRTTLNYEHVQQNDLPDWGVPGASISGTFRYDPTTAGAPRDAFYGLKSDFDDTTSDALSLRFEYDVSDWGMLTNQTRWTRVDRDARFTAPTGYVTATRQVTTQSWYYDRVNTTLTNQTNLDIDIETGPFTHKISTGIELSREESDANRFGTANPGNTGLFDPNPNRSPGIASAPTERAMAEIDTVALYAYDTIKVAPQWEVTGGLRAEYYQANIDSKTAAGAPTGAFDSFEKESTTLGGKIGIVYKPAPNGSIYASYGVSGLPPGSYLSNPDISRTGDNAFPGLTAGAKEVMQHNYEVGTKWDVFNQRLALTAAIFRTEKTNVPITGRDVGDTVTTLKGYGEQIVQGIELGASGNITNEWNLFGGIALMESERKHSAYLDDVRRRADPGDYGSETSTNGDELAFTPEFTANLWTTYRLPVGLTLGGGMQYVAASYLGRPDDASRIIPNGTFGKLPGYALFHAMVSYELTENVDVRFNIDNIFDEKYAASTNWNGTRAMLGAPRTFMLTMDVDF